MYDPAVYDSAKSLMDKGNTLKPSIDKAIKALKANGTIGKLQRKWLPFTRVPVLK